MSRVNVNLFSEKGSSAKNLNPTGQVGKENGTDIFCLQKPNIQAFISVQLHEDTQVIHFRRKILSLSITPARSSMVCVHQKTKWQ